ncbi:MAG: 3-oxoisoapionate kinase [Acidobacteriaceae bacterium]|nr:3-oxoisoapionate kinase [Acidobacteriaceae bacterium]
MALLYCYYGDDFTGSTDVLEQLAGNGVASVLFLSAPTAAQLARFSACQAIGFAGDARSRTPEWMSANLPAIFTRMRDLGPAIVQYKVCSTFDSAPHRGSIGRALEIGREVFATQTVPIGVAAPHLGRFVVFGNLFAAAGKQMYRIDRHPTMAHHPATPMDEADLRLHLARQTNLAIGLVDLRAFQSGNAREQFRMQADGGAAAVLLDGVDAVMLQQAGQVIWGLAEASRPLFTVGSSGVTASLIAHWRSTGVIAAEPPSVTSTKADQILVISGSCSAVTAGQILWAKRQGLACLELDAEALARGGPGAVNAATELALQLLRSGRDTVLYTALGTPTGLTHDKELGLALGRLMLSLVQQTGVRRVVLCGGDTSSHAVQQLGLTALTFAGTLAPGAPLCRAHAEEKTGLDGLELVLKGGQIGPEDFFGIARYGDAG